MSVYDEPLPKQFTAPVICRIKRIFWYASKKYYELEPIVLPERDDKSQVREVRQKVREKDE